MKNTLLAFGLAIACVAPVLAEEVKSPKEAETKTVVTEESPADKAAKEITGEVSK